MKVLGWMLAGAVLLSSTSLFAADEAALAKETTAYCVETAKDASKLTPAMLKEKVEKAAALVEAEGPAAFPKFKGKGSEFIFCGTYIWVHDMSGKMQMHPIKHKMVGRQLLGLKDRKGKMFFVEMNKVAKEKGSGWVEYVWPKPGQKAPAPKLSFVKLAKHGGTEYIVGSGAYDMTMADAK